MVLTSKDTEGIPAPTISVFPYSKNNSAFRLSSVQMEEMYRGDLPCDDYLTQNTFNKSDALVNIFLGFTRKKSLLDEKNIVTEEMTTPSIGRYYVFRPSFKIGTNYHSDQIFLVLSQQLNYIVQVYDPHFYLGFFNPSLPMIRETLETDGTAGNYYSLMLTEVRERQFGIRIAPIFGLFSSCLKCPWKL